MLFMLAFWACTVSLEFDAEGCPSIRRVNVVGIEQIFFSPFINQVAVSSTDTVSFRDFRLNFELAYQSFQQANLGSWIPGLALAQIDCEPRFFVENISNIMVILNEPFNGFSVGTDIAFLLSNTNDIQLNRLRDFRDSRQFFSFRFNQNIGEFQQLKANLLVTLRDGTILSEPFVSPFLVE
ncbi:MAG: hypothetical protein ACXIUD_13110 [Mongoliitalea sp.]